VQHAWYPRQLYVEAALDNRSLANSMLKIKEVVDNPCRQFRNEGRAYVQIQELPRTLAQLYHVCCKHCVLQDRQAYAAAGDLSTEITAGLQPKHPLPALLNHLLLAE
jgi:hypothetical protein